MALHLFGHVWATMLKHQCCKGNEVLPGSKVLRFHETVYTQVYL